jgi:molecular chaperone DnaK
MLLEGGGDLNALRDAYQRLEAASFRIAESMYGTDGG